ncbi:MAG: LysR family transcriptional regulator [Methylocella sp.]
MERYQIKQFVAVAETGGFTKGAQRVAISQPAISASIAKLEAELDVKLLDRRRSPVVPTAAGARLLEAGKNILHQTDQDDRALALAAAGIGLALVPAHFELSAVK